MPPKPLDLQSCLQELTRKPGHEKVRALVYDLLVHHLGCPSEQIEFEKRLPEARGRTDALLGRTVFEFKRDMDIEKKDAEEELSRYLPERERATGDPFIGIATDGSYFAVYGMEEGQLVLKQRETPDPEHPRQFLAWLDGVLSLKSELEPNAETIRKELGRESAAYWRALALLRGAWTELKDRPDVLLKKQLWEKLLSLVYGAPVENEHFFLQHTYLTIVAKSIAHEVLGISSNSPKELLEGEQLRAIGILGAVESDFFDWALSSPQGEEAVARISRQTKRFKFHHIAEDVLKSLYESLIDPQQRYLLGEYYTPDWLAKRVVDRAIQHPLTERVLDPSCGSGSFIFHAVRKFREAAIREKIPETDIAGRCTQSVLGLDVHPVAAIIARVTYLLALGPDCLSQKGDAISIPVYLGDSMQWDTEDFFGEHEVHIQVPGGGTLQFPNSVCSKPVLLDSVIDAMVDFSEQDAKAAAMAAWLEDKGFQDKEKLVETYTELKRLRNEGRNHIWGYVARNQARPLSLSSPANQVDVLIGNPPWLPYRWMEKSMQQRFQQSAKELGLWVGGEFATHSDLSGYFFAECCRLYLKKGGQAAFVMPMAALSRGQFQKFREGNFAGGVRFSEVWKFGSGVQPLFPVPSAVMFAKKEAAGPLPDQVLAFQGALPRRDASLEEAAKYLTETYSPWPAEATFEGVSPYREKFNQGATLVPRVLCFVEKIPVSGSLGQNPQAPRVRSQRSNQEKQPWKGLPGLCGQIEAAFLKNVYLGESILPFRLLPPRTAVIPWHEKKKRLMDSEEALSFGYRHLSIWLSQAEVLWQTNSKGKMTFLEQTDYFSKLSNQFPISEIRVVFAKAGSLPAASVIVGKDAIIDHKLYWTNVRCVEEAHFLAATLNSETLRLRIESQQSQGQWGARDFDLVMFEQPIPLFDESQKLHRELAEAGKAAEEVAACVPLKETDYFTKHRAKIRKALEEDGISLKIEELVKELLDADK